MKTRQCIYDAYVFSMKLAGDSPPEKIQDESILLESGLDSLGFAVLVSRLEETLGFDPFSINRESYYPNTFGELIAFYERNEPSGI
jgi:acyl carrier protein